MRILNNDEKKTADTLALEWATDKRWRDTCRDYNAEQVVLLRGKVQVEYTLAKRGAQNYLTMLSEDGKYVSALGALTGNQACNRRAPVCGRYIFPAGRWPLMLI